MTHKGDTSIYVGMLTDLDGFMIELGGDDNV